MDTLLDSLRCSRSVNRSVLPYEELVTAVSEVLWIAGDWKTFRTGLKISDGMLWCSL